MSFTPPGMNPNAGMSEQEAQMVKMMQASMESCVGKTVMAGVMGGGLGAMFGLFMSSMRYDTPMSQPLAVPNAPAPVAAAAAATNATSTAAAGAKPTPAPTPAAASAVSSTATSTASTTVTHPSFAGQMVQTPAGSVPLTDLPLRQQLKHGLRDMYRSSLSSGKNFAKVGAIFSGTECAIEGLRAKNDLWNGVAGGCLTGGVLARNAGPQAAAVGCAGFAVFSAAIDAYMRMPEDERSRPIA
ncbi:mitochondrial import inner membrane translocase, subunit Tim17/22 [Paraphaeosphaeria sporulosa]|uniref:Mitochondrial import inner membrane translocase subunit TIM22 n=1 Tax=Paraphaeosphaeria sporulosa TaxID=1460663 RepID=A0A177CAS2_9PLEO|nr:mitochondrial import inner membrane translocase, subunit Tim17/22 [Paraphaeosphaeria sporulosa]OAG04773.1 mitochondrial import inner membrane translocase, subunit Tim17/22 [Paraphaeosphaeria sporulosa]